MGLRLTYLILFCVLLCGCGPREETSEGPLVVTTTDPFRAIVAPVLGDRATVRALLPAGASPHTYEPRPSDMRMLATADAFIYGAPQLDGWAARMESRRVAPMISWMPDALLLTLEDHDHGGIDPHFWMDPLAVKGLLPGLVDFFCEGDMEGCTEYRRNAEEFGRRLTSLNDSLTTMLAPVRGSTILLSHPFLGYFAARYGIEVAGIIEEIPGSEPTPQDMQRMVHVVQRSGARAIFTQPQLPARAAEAVAEVVGLPVVPLNPLSTGDSGSFSYEELLYYNGEKVLNALKGH